MQTFSTSCSLSTLPPLTCFSLNMDHWSHESSVVLLPPEWSSLVPTHLCESDSLCRFNCVLSDDEAKPSVVQLPEMLFKPPEGSSGVLSSFSSSCCCDFCHVVV